MKIIGAGFGRTGTMSIKAALEILGFGPCYHMKIALTRPWHIPFWLAAIRGRSRRWKRFFRKYNSTVDWPACEFYKNLIKVYPDAKVLLNVRDPDAWYESSLKTIYRIQYVTPYWFPQLLLIMQERLIWKGRFRDDFKNKELALSILEQHYQEVKDFVPPAKLLVYDVKQGWEPLCKFLEVPVPDKPFPHLNETRQYEKVILLLQIAGWIATMAVIAGIAWIVWIAWFFSAFGGSG